ncbi:MULTISPECIES: hypothetical protein [Pseudomonas]|uniref:Uncharacterized protein n=1 Tax=Pseudomonas piscis TaxID=2614538 RepID=A0ABY9NQ52_9PSED|nr:MULTISPECIES: hypothetical protein [Pseudomonas]WMN20328.1 hypothetical protein QL104_13335 [Pseudomonas piscis]
MAVALGQGVVDLARVQGQERIVDREAPDDRDFKELDRLWREVPA